MEGRVPGFLLITPNPAAFLNFSNTLFEIETEKVKLKATGNPILLLDPLVTTNAYVFRPSQLRHLTARGRHHRNFEENKRLFADQKNMYFLPCTFCTPHLEITSFICYGSKFTLWI